MPNHSVPFELDVMSNALNYRRAILRIFEPYLGRNILEVGGGVGFFSEALGSRSTLEKVCVIEPDPVCREYIRARCPAMDIRSGTAFDLPDETKFDSIVSINVLEHIKDDRAELENYREHLTEDGVFCLFVPARTELFSSIDATFGHHRRYNKKNLRQLLEKAGFNIVTLQYFNLAGYFLWFVNFILFRRKTFSSQMVRLNDRVIFPVTYFFEKLFRAPFVGQSLIVIARPCSLNGNKLENPA